MSEPPDRAEALQAAWARYLAAAARERDTVAALPAGYFPHFTDGDRWVTRAAGERSGWVDGAYEHGNWTAGFWFGVMWLRAVGASDDDARQLARSRLGQLAARATDTTTHDLGFLFYPAFAFGQATGCLPADAAGPGREAARTLARRWVAAGDYLQAFGPIGDARTAGSSTIDTLMNLPLLWWAAGQGEDPAIFDRARRHARTSSRLFFRPDGSTYHLNTYDPVTGALLHRGTFQGAGDGSCWSRGEAWAACGLAWAYAACGETELLEGAERALAYYLRHAGVDRVAPWDFSDTTPGATLDSAASAAIALACVILADAHPAERARRQYRGDGTAILATLAATCLNDDPGRDGILLHACYSKPRGLGVGSALPWGDFYFGLALARCVGAVSAEAVLGLSRSSER